MPLLNHFLERLGVEEVLDRFVPTHDRRTRLSHARCLGVLLRSILVEREPIYRQAETVRAFGPEAFGLRDGDVDLLGDDRIGRALDELFDADRGALLTQVVLALHERFGVAFERLHNDSTTVRFCGQYAGARGRSLRGKKAPWITYGYSKDHRPDLKQLVYILTTSDDGHVPVAFRCEAGNTNDSPTHVPTWDALCQLTGGPDFLYVADAKLCSREAMDHIDRRGGRFITVLPRSRGEDAHFRRWIQAHEPAWETVRDRANPRGRDKPRDVWSVWKSDLPSQEGWPLIWVHSTLLALHQERSRRERIERARQELDALRTAIQSPRSRLRSRRRIHERLKEILVRLDVTRYLRVKVSREDVHRFRQTSPGRPGPETTYRRVTRHRFALSFHVEEKVIEQERRHDGMYPLLTNDRSLTPAQVLLQHKRQPRIERRFSQLKDPMQIAPVFLKNEGRVEALFFLYALGLIVQALVEREIRRAMEREGIKALPLYPEERDDPHPTALQILRLFAHLERHEILAGGQTLRALPPALTSLQQEVLRLLAVPAAAYRKTR
ncbi:MAG: IS1634 family transposase [Planctomycetes bacterium]|nr:IS1634 family transposase [Planctomycetota bacterium]